MPVSSRQPAAGAGRHVGLILEQLNELPTLSAVAVRLLEVTSSQSSDAQVVTDVIASDPALSSKVLQLARKANCPITLRDATIDRAVVMLGFDRIRAAALSVQVFEMLEGAQALGGEAHSDEGVFDRRTFWHHCLAVAAASERLVDESPFSRKIKPGKAFLAGLLHDIGHLVMHFILPRTFDRVCAAAEARNISIDVACRRAIGMDTHTLGKRVAERWSLPRELIDCVWLNGQPMQSLPELSHASLIGVVGLADALARHQLLAHTGHMPRDEVVDEFAASLELEHKLIDEVSSSLHEEVGTRAAGLGLDMTSERDLLQRSIQRAEQIIHRQQAQFAVERHVHNDRAMTDDNTALVKMFDRAVRATSLPAALGVIAESAAHMTGNPEQGLIVWSSDTSTGELCIFEDSALTARYALNFEPGERPWTAVHEDGQLIWQAHESITKAGPEDASHVIPLGREESIRSFGVLVAEGELDIDLDVWRTAWEAVLAIALRHEHADQLSEQLVETNRAIVEMQEEIARRSTMAALGELASGAAHEMNNPLTVISGRAQLLVRKLDEAELNEMARDVASHASRLSDLIQALHLFASEPEPGKEVVNLENLFERIVADVRERVEINVPVRIELDDSVSTIRIDREHFLVTCRELVLNAAEAEPRSFIELSVHVDGLDDRLTVQVTDDGIGLSQDALIHGFDPFFSDKPAGRQSGLGLPRAQRLVHANGGRIILRNRPGGGTQASVLLEDWRPPAQTSLQAASAEGDTNPDGRA